MPRYIATTHVSLSDLERIVNCDYDTELSADEKALVAQIPDNLKPWFEQVVVNSLYLPFRGVMKSPHDALARLVTELLPHSKGQKLPHRADSMMLTIRGTFELGKRNGRYNSVTTPQYVQFEEWTQRAIESYATRLKNVIKKSIEENIPFKYIGTNWIVNSLRSGLN